jgi:hypothetical protein
MRNIRLKPSLVLCILCFGLLLTGVAMAEDQSETYGAYPGAPSQVPTPTPTPAPIMGQMTIPNIYPTQPTTITATPTMQTVANTGTIVTNPATTRSPSTVTAVYYTQAPPAAQQNVLLTYNVQTTPPAAVYYSGSYMPWTSFYQVFSANSPALWISSSVGWSWYATSPVGGWVQELMYVPVTGTMKLYDLYPDGTTKYYSYGFATPGYKYRWFHANMPGRYMTMLTITDIPSNYIIIDVA